MNRKAFLKNIALLSSATVISKSGIASEILSNTENEILISKGVRPRAITMWDFSWLERRWPGAGYEDWDNAGDDHSTHYKWNQMEIEFTF